MYHSLNVKLYFYSRHNTVLLLIYTLGVSLYYHKNIWAVISSEVAKKIYMGVH